MEQKACLILNDGSILEGFRFGSDRQVVCEVVFSTGLTGYVELLTDPSFCGQAVTMANPIIGNYGVFEDVSEAAHVWVGALILRDLTPVHGDERNAEDLDHYLKRNGVPGIYGIDTRALTIKIREEGTKIGVIMNGAKDEIDIDEANRLIASYDAKSVVPLVSPKERAFYPAWVSGWEKDAYVADAKDEKKSQLVRSTTDEKHAALYRVAVLDFGAKHNILWNLVKRGCEVYDCPWNTSAEEILSLNPDGIFLSNGPGDPTNCGDAITEIKKLYDTGIPMFGICLGHQLMALATGAKTRKLKYGHRGANHPVKDIKEDRVYITSQNHGYVVVDESVDPKVAVVSHVNVNDGTNEGLDYLQKPVFTVQYHPEGAPGPQDNNYLFDQFIDLIEKNKKK